MGSLCLSALCFGWVSYGKPKAGRGRVSEMSGKPMGWVPNSQIAEQQVPKECKRPYGDCWSFSNGFLMFSPNANKCWFRVFFGSPCFAPAQQSRVEDGAGRAGRGAAAPESPAVKSSLRLKPGGFLATNFWWNPLQ